MDLNQIVSSIAQYGVGGACLAYFMWERSSTLKELTKAIESLNFLIAEMKGSVKNGASNVD